MHIPPDERLPSAPRAQCAWPRTVLVPWWRRASLLLLGIAVLTGCADSATDPFSHSRTGPEAEVGWRPILPLTSLSDVDPVRSYADVVLPDADLKSFPPTTAVRLRGPAVLSWNELARQLVAFYRENPPRAARGYALLSVAQYDALVAIRRHHATAGPQPSPGPHATGPVPGVGADRAAVAGASVEVLRALFPDATQRLEEELNAELAQLPAGRGKRDAAAAFAIGRGIGLGVLAHAATDGSDAVWTGEVPAGDGFWFSSAQPPAPPLLPLWGSVRPWLMSRGNQLRPPPPPAFGSPGFLAALAEVRQISDARTDEQLRIALYWADDPGTSTPPGHWNAIAADLIRRYHMPEIRAAWTLALLNMALIDASISCWDAKYVHWLIRPSQVDPLITTPVPLPNFPSYTSGHATFSGAAAGLLGDVFPAQRGRLRAMAEEAAISRVYGGIHYRFDSDMALEAGFAIGQLAVERGRRLNPGQR